MLELPFIGRTARPTGHLGGARREGVVLTGVFGGVGAKRATLIVAGLAFFWQMLRFHGLSVIFDVPPNGMGEGILWYGALLGVVACCCVAALSPRLARSPAAGVPVTVACSCAASVAIIAKEVVPELSAPLGVAAMALFVLVLGVAFVTLLLGWLRLLGELLGQRWRGLVLLLTLSCVATLALTACTSFEATASASAVFRGLFPAASAGCLAWCAGMREGAGEDAGELGGAGVGESVGVEDRRALLAFVGLCALLLVAATAVKGNSDSQFDDFLNSPALSYSHMTTLAMGVFLGVAAVACPGPLTAALLAGGFAFAALVTGLLLMGFLGDSGALMGSALVVSSRALAEMLLLAGVALLSSRREAGRVAWLFAVPELASTLLRRLVLARVAWGQSADYAQFALQAALPLAVGLLVTACAFLGLLVMRLVRPLDASGASTPGDEPAAMAGGETSRAASHRLADAYGLTPKETVILDWLLRGYGIPDIARREGLSESTVRTHYRNIYAKLDVHSKTELIDLAERCADKPNA